MVNVLKLKAKVKEKDLTQEELASKIGVNPSTLNKKINNIDGDNLTIKEAGLLKEILEIPDKDLLEIFFG